MHQVINDGSCVKRKTAEPRPLHFRFPGRNVVPGQSGPCVRPEDLCLNKTDKDVGERVPFSPVLGEGFPLFGWSPKLLYAETPKKLRPLRRWPSSS